MKIDALDFSALSAPFPPAAVSWRVGQLSKDKTKARALAYLDARDVMDRLDGVCGHHGWQCEYVPMPNGTACCRIGINVGGQWIWKANGAEMISDGDKADQREMAIKGSYSDAFKRAAVLWGIGRYLYSVEAPWVRVNEWRQIETDELPRLQALLPGAEPRKTARQARKDDDWKGLAASLRLLKSGAAIDEFISANSAAIARMPRHWAPHWSELVSQVRAGAANDGVAP